MSELYVCTLWRKDGGNGDDDDNILICVTAKHTYENEAMVYDRDHK